MARPHPSLAHTDHRPWPMPAAPWQWRQSWLDLAFLHYRVDAAALRPMIPAGLRIQEFDGSAWVAVVPFRMFDVMRGSLPSVPPLRSFPELNVRTYVEAEGRPGVWFFSLDADCTPLVWGARVLFGLPYFKARMSLRREDGAFQFSSERRGAPVRFRARYRPVGDAFFPEPGTFERWAAERYCLYSHHWGKLLRLEVHHAPWPLQTAEARIETSDLLAAAGIAPLDPEPRCHFSTGVEVVSFSPHRVGL